MFPKMCIYHTIFSLSEIHISQSKPGVGDVGGSHLAPLTPPQAAPSSPATASPHAIRSPSPSLLAPSASARLTARMFRFPFPITSPARNFASSSRR
jgi:hypothetical protein